MEFRFTMKNYGTIEKTILLFRELWNFNIRRKNKQRRFPKAQKTLISIGKNNGNLEQFVALEL